MMKQKMIFTRLFAFIIVAALLGSCKYEDGPFISFRSETRRLILHHRKITLLEFYGQDLLPRFNQVFPNSEFNFGSTETNGWASLDWSFTGPNGYAEIKGGYNLSPVKEHDRKTYINLNLMGVDSLTPLNSSYPPLQDVVGWAPIYEFEHILFPGFDPTLGMRGPYPHFEITKLTNNELHLKNACYQCNLGYTYRIHFKDVY